MSSMDAGRVDIDLNLGAAGLKRGVRDAKREIAGLDKEIRKIEGIRSRVTPDVFGRSFYAQDLRNLEARRAALSRMATAENQATAAAKQRARAFGVLGGGGLGRAARFGAVGLGANILGRNLQEISDDPQALTSRVGGFLSNITSGNVVGAVKAAAAEVKLTDDQVKALGTDASLTSREIDTLAGGLDALGQSGAADKLREIRNEMVALAAVQFATREINTATVGGVSFAQGRGTRPDDRGGFQGPGGIAARQRLVDAGVIPRATQRQQIGLTQQHQVAIAGAEALGGRANQLAQLRRAERFLVRQVDAGLPTEKARGAVFGQLSGIKAQIKALTPESDAAALRELKLQNAEARAQLTERKKDDREAIGAQIDYYRSLVASSKGLKKEQARAKMIAKQLDLANLKTEQELQFQQISPSAVVGGLGQGPFLTSPVAQFAQGFGFKPKAGDFLKDIRSQVRSGSRFASQLERLRGRGLGDAAAGELAGMGLGAADQVAALAKAPASLVRQFGAQVAKRERVAERIQMTATTVELRSPSVVIRADRVVGIDRNGNGALDPRERFTTTAAGR